jgi:glycosyltransferase involved in cell wall biosynthesis
LRVLLVGANSSTPGVGGVAHVQRRVAAALTDLGVDVVQLFRTGHDFTFVRTGDDDHSPTVHEVRGARAVKSTLDGLRPDVLHVTFAMSPLASLVAAWARHAHVPIVAHPEGALDPRFLAHHRLRKYPYLATIERPLRHADAVVSVTEGDLGDNSRWFGRHAAHFIIPNIVDPPPFARTIEDERKTSRIPTKAIYFGRINDYHKGISRLVALARRTPDIHYSLVGAVDKSDRVALGTLADLPPNVELFGSLQGDDLYRRVAAADFFVHPARFEAFGNTIPEALSVHCPVFVSRETYLAHTLIARELGHVLDFSDVAVAESELREHLSRPDELRRRTDRGSAWVRDELSSRVVGTSLVRVYDHVLGLRPGFAGGRTFLGVRLGARAR